MRNLVVDGQSLQIEDLLAVAHGNAQVSLSPHVYAKLDLCRQHVELHAEGTTPVYGINTGFGALSEQRISLDGLKALQHNLIVSHACGVGEPLSISEARALCLLRANTLARGHSGVRPVLVENLLALLNAGCAPYVPRKGSVGASGDLAPLAHLALLLLGLGDAYISQERTSAQAALKHAGLEPLVLMAKEGLALINGTQAMLSVGSLALLDAERLCDLADVVGACTHEALLGKATPFDPRIHEARPHPGQMRSAARLRKLLCANEAQPEAARVQDPYSLRCMPQVHGASRDALAHVRSVMACEVNSSTDNPLVFDRQDGQVDVLSGGNFHGQTLALSLDFLALAASELANISERRLEQLVNPALSAGLPAFLSPEPGLNSGFMIWQVTAAALVNENKVLCHPASTDSIPTSANREDHVSMGMTAANKARQVIENTYCVLAIELMAACQALDLRQSKGKGHGVAAAFEQVRNRVEFAPVDRMMDQDLTKILALLKSELRTEAE